MSETTWQVSRSCDEWRCGQCRSQRCDCDCHTPAPVSSSSGSETDEGWPMPEGGCSGALCDCTPDERRGDVPRAAKEARCMCGRLIEEHLPLGQCPQPPPERPEGPEVAERLAISRQLNPAATEYEVGWHAGYVTARAQAAKVIAEYDADNEAIAAANEGLAADREAAWAEVDALVAAAVTAERERADAERDRKREALQLEALSHGYLMDDTSADAALASPGEGE